MNIETANRLTALRKANNYSQEALAAALNISRQAISKWERGEASPDTDNLIALARLYCVSLDEMLGIKAEQTAEALPVTECEENDAVNSEEARESESTVDDLTDDIESFEREEIAEPPEETNADVVTEETDPGFCIENDDYVVNIRNGVLSVAKKQKKLRSRFAAFLRRFRS